MIVLNRLGLGAIEAVISEEKVKGRSMRSFVFTDGHMALA